MKYKLFFIAVLIVLFFNCKNEGPATDNQNQMPEASTEMVVNPDSLKKVYENKLAEKTNTLPVTQVREKGKLNPVDEAPVDTVFFLFREKLLDIIRQKDLVALLSNMKDNAKVSFGDPQEGPAGFVEIWGLDTPAKAKNSEVWKHLENALNLGGQFRDKRSTFIAPYVYSSFPDDYDAFEYHVITGSGVRMRSEPSLNARILKSLSYNIVKVLQVVNDKQETIGGETHPWVKIQLPESALEGFVYGKYLRSPIDYRIGFEKNGRNWQISFFVAGD